MYHPIGIQKLSPAQIRKMLKGERVIVKHGAGHKIHVSQEQHKKIMKAHQKGCGCTIQMDPYQMSQMGHGGEGFKEDYLDKIGNAFSSTFNRHASPQEQQQLRGMLDVQNEIASHVPVLGQIWNPVSNALASKYGVGEGVRHRGRPRMAGHGEGVRHRGHGEGVRHRGHGEGVRHRGHGEGWMEDIGRELLPVAKELGTAFIKKKAGLGVRGRHAKKQHIGMALNPAGYGEGIHKKHHKRGHKGKGAVGSVLGSILGDILPF